MAFDISMNELLPDEITLEPFLSMSVQQAITYGAAVTYRATITAEWTKAIDSKGTEVDSNVSVIIPGRVHIDPRDRITLPSGWVPRQPRIISVMPIGGVNSIALDNTEIRL